MPIIFLRPVSQRLTTLVLLVVFATSCAYNAPLSGDAQAAPDRAIVFADVAIKKGAYGAFALQNDSERLMFWQDARLFDYQEKRMIAFAVPAGIYTTHGWELHVDRHQRNLEILRNKRTQPVPVQLAPGSAYYLGTQTIHDIIGTSLFDTKIVVDAALVVENEQDTATSTFRVNYPQLADLPIVSLVSELQAGTTTAASVTARNNAVGKEEKEQTQE